MERPDNNRYIYVVWALAASALGAGLYVAAGRVPFVAAAFGALGDVSSPVVRFFYRRPDMAGDPGLWLKHALCVVGPALLWAAALGRAFPGVAVRFAGLVTRRSSAYVLIAASVAAVAALGIFAVNKTSLHPDEAPHVFQGRIFARGALAAPVPQTEEGLKRAFFRSKDEVAYKGRWFSAYAPGPAALSYLGGRLGWPKLFTVAGAGLILLAVFALGRRTLGPYGGAVALVLAATSPFFLITQASYLPEATLMAFVALGWWAAARVGDGRASPASVAALGVAAGGVLLTREYALLYLGPPLLWYLWRRGREGGSGGTKGAWFALGAAPFALAWLWYNWRQTGHAFLPPLYFANLDYFGFEESGAILAALSSTARNLTAFSVDAFGWPLLCLLPAAARPFLGPRLDAFEKAMYATVLLTALAHFPLREVGIAYGASDFYPAWFALVFITARFFVILSGRLARRFPVGAEGVIVAVASALVAFNLACYVPAAITRCAGRPAGNRGRWADEEVRLALAELGVKDAVVLIKPRAWCLSTTPGSPFLDDDVVYGRDNGEYNGELKKIFPGRRFYLLDYRQFRRTGEIGGLEARSPVNVPHEEER
ncbi:MAG: glycosyltransferase family 39 protein [Candidatus Zixiibacteriota bacterium]|jgi:hypothetical protein